MNLKKTLLLAALPFLTAYCSAQGGGPLSVGSNTSTTGSGGSLPWETGGSGSPPATCSATCTLSVSNSGIAFNSLASGYNSSLTLSRSGTAVGPLSFTVNGGAANFDSLLNINNSAVYGYVNVPTGNYAIVSQVTQADGSVCQCGSFPIVVNAPPSGSAPPPTPAAVLATGAIAQNGCGAVSISGTGLPVPPFIEISFRDTNWNIVGSTTIVSSSSLTGVIVNIPQGLQSTFQSPGLRFTVSNLTGNGNFSTSPFASCTPSS